MIKTFFTLSLLAVLVGCASTPIPPAKTEATLTPRTSTYLDLKRLPEPKGKIIASVYSFRDQSGQYKSAPSSSFSTAVTQGATALLSKAMYDSNWFITLEREGLSNLLNERKIIRAAQEHKGASSQAELPALLSSNILLEGSIVGYDSNVRTGGAGVRYLGVGSDEKYVEDMVTINLRTVDTRTGRVLTNVMTTKTILSIQINSGVYKFIEYKELLEAEAGITRNEPKQLCVQAAIEAAVLHTIAEGIRNRSWALASDDEINNPVLAKYLEEVPEIVEIEEDRSNAMEEL